MKIKTVMVFLVAALTLIAFTVQAAEQGKKAPSPAQQAQQEKMKSCSAEAKAKALKGDERKAFMKTCLSGKTSTAPAAATEAPAAKPAPATAAPAKAAPAVTKPVTQQEKMKACNAEAKTKALKGDERKKFMSECLKK